MQMKNLFLSAAALVLAGAGPALAADVLGRISYIYPDGHRLILDSQKEYAIAPGVDMSKHGVAEFVRLTVGANNEVTAIAPGPANLAGTWTPPPGRS